MRKASKSKKHKKFVDSDKTMEARYMIGVLENATGEINNIRDACYHSYIEPDVAATEVSGIARPLLQEGNKIKNSRKRIHRTVYGDFVGAFDDFKKAVIKVVEKLPRYKRRKEYRERTGYVRPDWLKGIMMENAHITDVAARLTKSDIKKYGVSPGSINKDEIEGVGIDGEADAVKGKNKLVFSVSLMARNGVFIDVSNNLYMTDYPDKKIIIGRMKGSIIYGKTLDGEKKMGLEDFLKNKNFIRDLVKNAKEFKELV